MDGGARQEPKDEEKRSRGISGHPPGSARGQRGFPRPCERSGWTRTHTAGLGSVRGVAGPREGIRRGRSGARARPAGLAAGDLSGGRDLDDVGRPRLSRFKLRFEGPDLEQQFLLAYRAAARPWIRMSLVVALSTHRARLHRDRPLAAGRPAPRSARHLALRPAVAPGAAPAATRWSTPTAWRSSNVSGSPRSPRTRHSRGLLNRAALEAQAPTLWQQAQAGGCA